MIRNAFVYHPTVVSEEGINFEDILRSIGEYDEPIQINVDSHTNYSLKIAERDGFFVLSLQRLSNGNLPFVANMADGSDEKQLEIGDNEGLSFKNIFVFNLNTNKLFGIRPDNLPKAGRLRLCLQDLYNKTVSEKVKIRFGAVMNRDLVNIINDAKTITSATITSLDRGDNINEPLLTKYDQYLGGVDYIKTTKLKGKKGANIKHLVAGILSDITDGYELESYLGISMCIDGQSINFNRFYRQIPLDLKEDSRNKRYLDYSDLEEKLIRLAKDYKDEE